MIDTKVQILCFYMMICEEKFAFRKTSFATQHFFATYSVQLRHWGKKDKNGAFLGPFWGVVFHENTSSKSKSKGAELFWAIAPMLDTVYSSYLLPSCE